ncbi:MAG: DUF1189 family protein [Candidatus Izemoplasmatales bacterium]|jgi:hypothetical protein|nr:DUF1189 family protein [Candidatus Izemoplasmatales bacterium]
MLKLFVGGFTPRGIFSQRDVSLKKVILYFIFLVFVISFPLNLQITQSGGWDLYNFTAGIQSNNPSWLPSQLPDDIEISSAGMTFTSIEVSTFQTTNVNDEILYIVFAPSTYYVYTTSLVFEEHSIVYYNELGNKVFSVGYNNIKTPVYFSNLKLMTDSEAIDSFTRMINEAFSPYAVFKSIFLYTIITFMMNIVLVVVLSAIFIFIRVRYQKVTTFSQNIRIIIASMTIPSMVGFVVGIIGLVEFNAFSVVIFQFMTPLIALFSIFKGAGIKEISNKYS